MNYEIPIGRAVAFRPVVADAPNFLYADTVPFLRSVRGGHALSLLTFGTYNALPSGAGVDHEITGLHELQTIV